MSNNNDFFLLFTDYCDPACYFGSKQGGLECICNSGYWNTSCDTVCPGGTTNPCSGYGSCDSKTGMCACPSNRQGSDDCSTCSSGWIGTDCDIAVSDVVEGIKVIGIAGQLGHMTNLDGLSFIIRDPAEYTLLTLSDVVMIEGKLVSCHQNYTCFTFMSFRIGDSAMGYAKLTIQASKQDNNKSIVYLEDQANSLDSTLYFKGFKAERLNSDEIKITIGVDVELLIRQQGQYLTLQVQLRVDLLNFTSGLLGGSGQTNATLKLEELKYRDIYSPSVCTYSGTIQSVSPSEVTGYHLTFTEVNVETNLTATAFQFSRFEVNECDRFIYYPTLADEKQNVGGFSLNFVSTVVSINIDLYTDVGPNITFDFLVKIANISGNAGVLFSFSNNNLFMIQSAESLEVTYNNITFATNLTLETDEWNKVVVMYYGELGDLDIYVFNSTGYIQRRSVLLSTGIFSTPGTFSMGHWQPPSSGKPMTAPTALQGQLDNFLIWKIPVEPNIIVDIYQLNPLDIQQILYAAWLFDDGQGEQTSDFIQSLTIDLPSNPWVQPSWTPSDLVYDKYTEPEVTYVFFNSTAEEEMADQVCKKIRNNTYSECSNVPTSTKDILYTECMQVYSTTKDLASVNNVILGYGKVCEVVLNLPESPVLTPLCNSLEITIRENSGCPKTCVFGEQLSNGTCLCTYGYYGDNCSNVCPGGSDTPCSNHGKCDDNGGCTCDWNWDGSLNCGTCTAGMTGPDCDVLYTGSSLGTKAYVTSQGNYMGFDGHQISLDELTGTYFVILNEDKGFAVETYQVSCQFGACVIGLSITTGDTRLVVLPSGQKDVPPTVYSNSVKIDYDTTSTISASVDLEMDSYAKLKFTVKTPETNVITITAQEQWIDFALDINSAVLADSEGILPETSSMESMSHSDLMKYLEKKYRSEGGTLVDTLSTVYGVDVNENAGFALSFNKTAAQSEKLKYNSNTTLNSEEFSLGIYFKPAEEGGVILSNSKDDQTFSIYNTDPMILEHGTDIITTSISPQLNEWNQFIMTMDGKNNQMHLYHYGPNASMTYQIIEDFIPDLFSEGGKVALAEWIPSSKSPAHTFTDDEKFIGEIEEISVWTDPIPSHLITQADSLNVKGAGFLKNVSTLWSFSEGFGSIATDDVLSNDLQLPSFPWQTPEWVASDLDLQNINPDAKNTIEMKEDIKLACNEFFDSAAINSACAGVSQSSKNWFKQQCIVLGSTSSDVEDSMVAMTSFISACAAQGGTPTSLYTEMCKQNGTVPFWVTQECNNCGFGYMGSDGACLCYYGYWGPNCDELCPNGNAEPCNNHGACDIEGKCHCEGHWTGTTCDSCGTGWEGDECVVLPTGQPAGQSNLIAHINNYGQMVTFDGYLVDLTAQNVYKLFGHSGVQASVYAHMSVCNDTKKTHYCLNDIMFEAGGVVYYVRASNSFGDSKVKVFTSTGETEIFEKTTIGNVQLSISQNNFLTINMTDINLQLDIMSIENGLIATMSYPNEKFDSETNLIEGLVASCDTKTALQLADCESATRGDICNKIINSTTAGSCVKDISYEAIDSFLENNAVNNTEIDTILEREYVITGPSCLQFSGTNGIFADDFELPDTSEYSVEFNVKPTAVNGPMLTYHTDSGDFITFVNFRSGLAIIENDNSYQTGIKLDVDKWNQVNLAVDKENGVLGVYVTKDSGEISVKEIEMNVGAFTSGGTLTVGQIGNGVTTLAPIGQFNGYIDELRMWTRPQNPSIIKNNWRKDVTEKTPDLFAAWSFSEGTGYLSSDIKNQNMYPVNLDNPPTWASSDDLELTQGIELNLPQLTTAEPYSLTTTSDKCTGLFEDSRFTTQCSGLENFIETMLDQCSSLVKTSGNEDLAEVLLLSTAEYCKNANSLTESPANAVCDKIIAYDSYLSKHGTSCNQECQFGTFDSVSGQCECDSGHWGSSCAATCSLGTDGSCNSHGACNGTTGGCNCDAHWLGSTLSTTNYWKTYATNAEVAMTDSTFNCSECTTGMYGSDCKFAVQAPKSSQTYAVGFLMGSYITTLDGVSYKLITPGTYTAYSAGGVSVQVVFWPCNNDISCREIKEISVSSGGQTVSILKGTLGMDALHVGGSTTLEYPVITTVSNIEVKWNTSDYIRLTSGGFSVLVSDSNIGLICRFRVQSSSAKSATGLLGNTDTTWYNDLISPDDSSTMAFVESQLSTSYIGGWTKTKLGTSLGSVHTYYDSRLKDLSTSGYMLHLTTQTVSFNDVYTSSLNAFTVSFWSRIDSTSKNITQHIISYEIGLQNLTVKIKDGLLQVDFGMTLTTNIAFELEVWNYITVTWDSASGLFMVYRIANNGEDFKYKSFLNVLTSGTMGQINKIEIYGSSSNPLDIDMLRMWSTVRSFDSVLTEKSEYTKDITSDENLIILSKFDEGTGLSASIIVQTGSGTTTVTGTISTSSSAKSIGSKAVVSADDLWSPSDIPTVSTFTPEEVTTDNVDSAALTACINALSNSDVNSTCYGGDISSLSNFLLESCLADYSTVGVNGSQTIIVENLIYYCQATFDVDECTLTHYFDYCTDEEEDLDAEGLNIMIIVAAVAAIIVLIIISVCCCWCFGKLCFRKKKKVVGHDYDSDDDEDWRPRSSMSDRSVLTATNVDLEDQLFSANHAFGGAMAPLAYNFKAKFPEKAKKPTLKAGKMEPVVSMFDAEADESIPLKTDSSLFKKPKLVSNPRSNSPDPRPQSPFVQPGINYQPDNAEIFSPFQPETETQSFSFKNRGFSPDEAEQFSVLDSRRESVTSNNTPKPRESFSRSSSVLSNAMSNDTQLLVDTTETKPSVQKMSIIDKTQVNTTTWHDNKTSTSLGSRKNTSNKIETEASSRKPQVPMEYIPEQGVHRQSIMNNQANNPFQNMSDTEPKRVSRHANSFSPTNKTNTSKPLRSRHSFDASMDREDSYVSMSSMGSQPSRPPSRVQSPNGNEPENEFKW